jgi:serine protease Do
MNEVLQKLRAQKVLSLTLLVFTLAVGIVIGTLIDANTGVKAAKDNPVAPGATPLVIPNPVELSNTFSQIAKQVEPSVVNISTTYNPKPNKSAAGRSGRRAAPPQDEDEDGQGGQGGDGMNEFLYRFFGNPFGNGGPDMPQRKGYALGSGVVVDKAGYILTNNHVIEKADRIQVKFPNDPVDYDAKVIGADAATDLAVIRVEGKKNPAPARIGNSDSVQVGDWAIAIGSPFGFQATVTAGIISAKEREVDPGMQFQHFLQTDAAINPGNSGGPLLNIRGEVIGINTAIASRSGGYQGVGFALPVNTAAEVYNAIIKTGRMTRGSIGISFTPSESDQARALLKSFGATEGVFVQTVAPGGPSEKAGIKEGDIIVGLNGKPVRNGGDLVNTVTATPIGAPVDVSVLRNGKRQNLKVVVGDMAQIFPDKFGGEKDQLKGPEEAGVASFGMMVQNLSESRRQNLGIKEPGGIEVVSVDPDSFADDIHLHKGDILLSINQHPIRSTDDLKHVQATLKPGDAVAFKIMTKGRGGDWTASFVAGALPVH